MFASGPQREGVRDRRADRTRAAVVAAFDELMLQRGYGRVTVRDVIERAQIGRSTFYEHFDNKLDVLEDSMAPVLAALADAVAGPRGDERLRVIVDHFRSNRELAIGMLRGAARPLVTRLLARLIEERLKSRGARTVVPFILTATALAGAQLALLEAWLSGAASSSPDAVARALAEMTRGAVAGVQIGG